MFLYTMPITEILHEIKDYTPLTVERLRQIRELSHQDKMDIIQTTFMVFLFTAKDIGSDKPEYKPKDRCFVYEFVHTIK